MSISVVIAAYNGSRTIEATVSSVFRQSLPADEILVMDDGSSDDTRSILRKFEPRITLLRQKNCGVAVARNVLCDQARGDLVAFVDQDDLWHPRYLEAQSNAFRQHPTACALFTWHINFTGYGDYSWNLDAANALYRSKRISPLDFLRQYNRNTGYFASMSYCCVPKRILKSLGVEPFRLSGVDDSYLCTTLPLYGDVVYTPTALVAYRVTDSAQSVDRLKMYELWVQVFELLQNRYDTEATRQLRHEFRVAYASRRRQYGKLLMTAGRTADARKQFRSSLAISASLRSMIKSGALLLSSFTPSTLQPAWPPLRRV